MVLETGHPRSGCRQGSVSGEASFPCMQMATFALCPHSSFVGVCMLLGGSLPLFIRTLALLDQGSTLMASFSLNYLLKGAAFKYSHIGV